MSSSNENADSSTASSSSSSSSQAADQSSIMFQTAERILYLWNTFQFGARLIERKPLLQPTNGVLFIYLIVAFFFLLIVFLFLAMWCRRDGNRIFGW